MPSSAPLTGLPGQLMRRRCRFRQCPRGVLANPVGSEATGNVAGRSKVRARVWSLAGPGIHRAGLPGVWVMPCS